MSEIKSNADVEPCLSVVMPVDNEAATVVEMIKIVLLQRAGRSEPLLDLFMSVPGLKTVARKSSVND